MTQEWHVSSGLAGTQRIAYTAESSPWQEKSFIQEMEAVTQMLKILEMLIPGKIQTLTFNYIFTEQRLCLVEFNDKLVDYDQLLPILIEELIVDDGYYVHLFDNALTIRYDIKLGQATDNCRQQLIQLREYQRMMARMTKLLPRSRDLYTELLTVQKILTIESPWLLLDDDEAYLQDKKVKLYISEITEATKFNNRYLLQVWLINHFEALKISTSGSLEDTIQEILAMQKKPFISFSLAHPSHSAAAKLEKQAVLDMIEILPEAMKNKIENLEYHFDGQRMQLSSFNGQPPKYSLLFEILTPERAYNHEGWYLPTTYTEGLEVHLTFNPLTSEASCVDQLEEIRMYINLRRRIGAFFGRNLELYAILHNLSKTIKFKMPYLLFDQRHIYLRGNKARVLLDTLDSNEDRINTFLALEFGILSMNQLSETVDYLIKTQIVSDKQIMTNIINHQDVLKVALKLKRMQRILNAHDTKIDPDQRLQKISSELLDYVMSE